MLATRLRELVSLGLARTAHDGAYGLTDLGNSLLVALAPLWAWSDDWAKASGSDPNNPISDALIDALSPLVASRTGGPDGSGATPEA